jgi:hypothetical protein
MYSKQDRHNSPRRRISKSDLNEVFQKLKRRPEQLSGEENRWKGEIRI